VRAGFKFEGGGFGYNCFRGRCNHKFRWNGGPASENMYKLFDSAGIARDRWEYLLDLYSDVLPKVDLPRALIIKKPQEITLPSGSFPLQDGDPDDLRVKLAIKFLVDEKGVSPLEYPFFLTFMPPQKGEMDFRNRIIIPVYHEEKLIFYQGRIYRKDIKSWGAKYLNAPGVEREQLFSNMDELDRDTDAPLIVTEGFFDSLLIGGVSGLSNVLTDEQIVLLNRSLRRKIIVPDYDKAGRRLIEQSIRNEWGVSFPDWGSSCKDLGKAIQQYGKYKVASMIREGIIEDETQIRIMMGLYCLD